MHTARYLGDAAWTEAWCISWYAVRRGDVVWIQHSGGLHGFITNVCFHPKDRVGAIALINGVAEADELAMDLATIARDAVNAAPVAVEPPDPLRTDSGPCSGSTWTITKARSSAWNGGTGSSPSSIRTGTPGGRRSPRRASPTPSWWSPASGESGERVVFRRVPDGRVSSMFLASATLARLDPVVAPD